MRLFLAVAISFAGALFVQPKTYVDALRTYEGRSYMQESCSELICDAHRQVFQAKVHCSAQAIWDGCGKNLTQVTEARSLAEVDWTKVRGGDVLAMHGVHVIAYLGDGKCIDSDPSHGGVAEVTVQTLLERGNDPWFTGPVRVRRWAR